MKIVIFETEEWEQPAFEPLIHEHEVILLETKLTAENAVDYRDADIIVLRVFFWTLFKGYKLGIPLLENPMNIFKFKRCHISKR
jgi:lactate dehydrogenase-like 2-hydroxyacid dehydrogenase